MLNKIKNIFHPLGKPAAVVAIFLMLAIYKFWLVIGLTGYGLSNEGDGLGGLMWLEVLRIMLTENPWSYISEESLTNSSVGAGLMPGVVPPGIFWRIIIAPLLWSGVALDNIYDIWALIIYTLNGVAAYCFARSLGSNAWLAIFTSLLFVGLDNVDSRLEGHLTLAAQFGVLAQVSTAVTAGRRGEWRDYACLGFFSWLSFQVVEYYGFYGSIYIVLIYTGYLVIFRANIFTKVESLANELRKLSVAAGIFILLMSLSYPTLILGKLGLSKAATTQFTNFSHSKEELIEYSVINPLQLFAPHSSTIDFGNPWEFTYRIGPAILVFSFIALLLVVWQNRGMITGARRCEIFPQLGIFFSAGLLMALIAQRPGQGFSVAVTIFNIAPMFRVSARAYLLVVVSVIAIMILLVTAILDRKNVAQQVRKRNGAYLYAFLFIGLSAVYYSAVNRPLQQYFPKKLPDNTSTLEAMDKHGPGAFLQLPFYSTTDRPELSYPYLYDWSLSHRTLANAPMHNLPKTDAVQAKRFDAFASQINNPDAVIIEMLATSGVRYIVANCDSHPEKDLATLPGVTLVAKDGCVRLYELTDFKPSYTLADLINSIYVRTPDPNKKISRADCENLKLDVSIGDVNAEMNPTIKQFNVQITRGSGGVKWGDRGAEVMLGVMFFPTEKKDIRYEGNLGQKWVEIPVDLAPNSITNAAISFDLPKMAHGSDLWFSIVQPGNMWCFSQDGLGTAIVRARAEK